MNTPQDLVIPVAVVETSTSTIGVTLKHFSFTRGTPTTPGVISFALAALGEAGEWRSDVKVPPIRVVDDLESTDPAKRYAATILIEMMTKGTVVTEGINDYTDILIAAQLDKGIDLRGRTSWDVAKFIAPQYMEVPAE